VLRKLVDHCLNPNAEESQESYHLKEIHMFAAVVKVDACHMISKGMPQTLITNTKPAWNKISKDKSKLQIQ